MFNEELLADAMDEQEAKDFRHLERLYERFLACEEKGLNGKAKELYSQITALEKEMGLK